MDDLLSASVPSRSKTMRLFMTSRNIRQRHFQQADDTVRPAGAGSDHGRQEQHVTFAEGIISTGVLQLDRRPARHTSTRGICAAPTTNGIRPLIRVTPN